ncbi:MAG: hypothetical protein ACJARF_002800 [Alteromonadaceae bacterium]|jgi:hypothetical protein
MPVPSVDLETKQQGQTWLLPPYLYPLRQITNELDVGVATVQKWRHELVDNGNKFENDKPRIIVFPRAEICSDRCNCCHVRA